MAQSNGSVSSGMEESLLESLGRLSKRSGVLATIVLDRASGATLKTTGSLSSSRISLNTSASTEEPNNIPRELQGMEEMAAMVWNYVDATGKLIQSLDAEDEAKLLRLRTKRYELVIFPDAKYLLVVVHETPAA